MPNWKKVIVSGSNAGLNSLNVTNGLTVTGSSNLSGSLTVSGSTNIVGSTGTTLLSTNADTLVFTGSFYISGSTVQTGSLNITSITSSLQGTASWALNALNSNTASYALTASSAQNASDILIYVKNSSGAQINKGRVVRITGAVGDNPLIGTASYFNDNESANTLGITYENIANDSFGYVITEDTLLGISTDAFTASQLIYLGDTGSIIGTAPVAPLHAVRLGQVLRSQLNNGSIYVRIDNGYELGELHDVRDTTTTGSYGDLLVKSGSIWINSKQLTGSYGLTGSLQATSFTGSLLGTASFALNALTATSASYASVFTISSSLYSAQGVTFASPGGATTETIVSTTTGSYRAGFFDYTVYNSGNARAGTVMTAWNGSSVVYADNSTSNIGDTNNVTMSVILNGGNAELKATANDSGGGPVIYWTVQTTYRLI